MERIAVPDGTVARQFAASKALYFLQAVKLWLHRNEFLADSAAVAGKRDLGQGGALAGTHGLFID